MVDALVAAGIVHLALLNETEAPTWTQEPTRMLPSFWHPGSDRFVACSLAHAPAELTRRGDNDIRRGTASVQGCWNTGARPDAFRFGPGRTFHHRGTRGDMTGRTYADNRPYLLPETLEELTGPATGAILLPLHIDWSERIELHLDDPAELRLMYQRVIREAARANDLQRYLNAQILREIWPVLYLPVQVRRLWEDRFPDLALAA